MGKSHFKGREQVAETKIRGRHEGSRDFALWRTFNVEDIAYFDRQDEHIFVREEECALLAHRGRKGEEASWEAYSQVQVEAPPSPPPSAKSRRLEENEDSDNGNDTSCAIAAGKIMEGWYAREEELRVTRSKLPKAEKTSAKQSRGRDAQPTKRGQE